jgi:hypothetical protein
MICALQQSREKNSVTIQLCPTMTNEISVSRCLSGDYLIRAIWRESDKETNRMEMIVFTYKGDQNMPADVEQPWQSAVDLAAMMASVALAAAAASVNEVANYVEKRFHLVNK